jgi:Arc/MetJ-type ribon-helix-helix transcriptional regulator
MSTLSVPLTKEQEAFIEKLVKEKTVANKAEAVRLALRRLAEEEAVASVLKSEQEVKDGKVLRGDVRKLMKKLS